MNKILPLFGIEKNRNTYEKFNDNQYHICTDDMNLNRSYNHIQEPKSKSSDNHIINKLQEMFKEINWIVRDCIDAINDVYKKYQLRYSVNQHQDILMRILTPQQIKGYIDKRQAYLLFQNKNDAFNLFNGLKANHQLSYSNPREKDYKKNRNIILKQQKEMIRYSEPKQGKNQEFYQGDAPNLNSQLLRNKIRGEEDQSKTKFNMNEEEDLLKYRPIMKERKPGVRSRGVEEHLCNWIREESKRRPVGRVDVINKAKQFGKNRNLKASVGWYSNFIRRNTDIREILTRGNLVRKRTEVKKYPDQERKIEEQQSNQGFMGIYDEEQMEEEEDEEDENIKNEDSDDNDNEVQSQF